SKGGAHLAGRAENEDIAVEAREVGRELRCGRAEDVLELGHAVEPFGQIASTHSGLLLVGRQQGSARRERTAPHGRKSPGGGDGKPRTGKRADATSSPLDCKPCRSATPLAIEIGVGAHKRALFGGWRKRHAIDEMVAIALGVGKAQSRAEGKIVLHTYS